MPRTQEAPDPNKSFIKTEEIRKADETNHRSNSADISTPAPTPPHDQSDKLESSEIRITEEEGSPQEFPSPLQELWYYLYHKVRLILFGDGEAIEYKDRVDIDRWCSGCLYVDCIFTNWVICAPWRTRMD